MPFPNRAIVTAPIARDLAAELAAGLGRADIVRVPGATNGVLQAWDTLDQDFFTALADPALTIYPTFASIPLALKKMVVQVARYDDAAATLGRAWKRLVDCGAADFIRVTNLGVPSNKAASTMVAGDRPVEWEPLHRWLGNVAETLGAP